MDVYIYISRAQLPIISSRYTLSISPLCRAIAVFSPIFILFSPDLYHPLFHSFFIFDFQHFGPYSFADHRISFLDAGCMLFTIKMSHGDVLLNVFLHSTSREGIFAPEHRFPFLTLFLLPIFEK